jgi:hypothetical protein
VLLRCPGRYSDTDAIDRIGIGDAARQRLAVVR